MKNGGHHTKSVEIIKELRIQEISRTLRTWSPDEVFFLADRLQGLQEPPRPADGTRPVRFARSPTLSRSQFG